MIRAAIVTVSDRSASGEREDVSGSRLAEAVRAVGGEVVSTSLVPDERAEIERELCRLADSERVPLILTTGGTGLASRDVTPESTLAVIQREAPGLAEHVRRTTVAQTQLAFVAARSSSTCPAARKGRWRASRRSLPCCRTRSPFWRTSPKCTRRDPGRSIR
jgi:molybdenum cofactor synthesis domain-containing protein